MQTLYTIDSMQGQQKPGEALAILNRKNEESKRLFTYLIFFLTEVTRYAEVDARHKASKHLPSHADLNVNTKLAGNELLWKILEDPSFKATVSQYKLESIVDTELVKKIYLNLVSSMEYKEYIEEQKRDKKTEKHILQYIFRALMLPNENFTQHTEENFINWDDDAEMMETLVCNYLNKPTAGAFNKIIDAEKLDFAQKLLQTVQEKNEFTLELIKPKLKNWDADRIAALDLILLQMGVCEFLFFETIPTRVTINEYIDLAKEYSTAQSGQFVNGLLDNLNKELTASNKIEKVQFKNSSL